MITAGQVLVPVTDDDPAAVGLDPAFVVPRAIVRWAELDPERAFLVEVGGRTLTYGGMVAEIGRWVTLLRRAGVQPGERIVSMLPSSIDAHALWLAAACLGAVEVPVNVELRGAFLDHGLRDPGARLCFVRPDQADVPRSSTVEGMEVVAVPRDGSFSADAEPAPLDALPGPEDVSCVIYTSGTTGPSKGVVISWAQMSATVGRIPRTWLSERDAVYSFHPMFHVTGRSPLPSMCDVGGRVVLRERFSATEFWDDVRTHGCTSATVNTSLLLGAPERPDDADNPLRVCFTAGNRAHALRFGDRFGVHMVECYGSTEAGFPMAVRTLPRDTSRPCGWLRRGYEARIVDEAGDDVADDAPGELWVRPPARPLITLGYLGQPERTAQAIVDGWYRTGDRLVHRPDGSFEFVDRMGDTIRRLGENISSIALEAAVLADPEVLECAAIGVPDPVAGQSVLLVVVRDPAIEVDPAALHERLGHLLPRYMVPAAIAVRTTVPRTPNNKIRKAGLLAELAADEIWHAPVPARRGGPLQTAAVDA